MVHDRTLFMKPKILWYRNFTCPIESRRKGKEKGSSRQEIVEEVPLPTGLSELTYLWKTNAGKAENLQILEALSFVSSKFVINIHLSLH